MSNKEKALAVLQSFVTGDKKAVEDWVSDEKFIHHDLEFPDGKDGFLKGIGELKQAMNKIDTKRVIVDGDFVILHSECDASNRLLVPFDIFRFENGKIVEHWGNEQEEVEETVSGHSMVDGPTKITDMEKTEANKALVKKFVETVLIKGQYDQMSKYFDDDNYIQHNPTIPDKVSGLVKALEELSKQGGEMKFTKNHMILGEGNFTLAVSEGNLNGEHVSFYDLWRIENGKIAEHWDVIEPIPPQEEWKNQNGKF